VPKNAIIPRIEGNPMSESSTATAVLMQEMTANLDALLEHTLEQIQKPPAGTIAEVGHFRVLNGLKKKEADALEQLLGDFAYNIAATVLAMLDGGVEGEEVTLPPVSVTIGGNAVDGTLHQQFAEAWESE
jgi:uncharacterized protein involved in exopolysaccharide biosynthesis